MYIGALRAKTAFILSDTIYLPADQTAKAVDFMQKIMSSDEAVASSGTCRKMPIWQ
jgi:hypothetical protein